MPAQPLPENMTVAEPEADLRASDSPAGRSQSAVGRGWLKRSVVIVSLAAGAGLVLWLYGLVRYGSLSIALLAWQGYALAPVPRVQFLPAISGETPVSFTLQNLTAEPVTILGAESSCACTALRDLPVTIPARGEASLNVVMSPSERDLGQQMNGHVLLYLDVPSPPVTLEVHTSVSPTAKVAIH